MSGNPYMTHPNKCAHDLILRLIPTLYAGKKYRQAIGPQLDNELLIEAVSQQVSNAHSSISNLIEGVGVAQAVAADSDNLPNGAAAQIGWGMQFLAELDEAILILRDDTQHLIKDGRFLVKHLQ